MATTAAIGTIRVPESLLATITRALAADRSPREAAVLLRQIGFDAGSSFFEIFTNWLDEQETGVSIHSLPAPRFWRLFSDFWNSLGWGTLEHRQLHAGVAVLESTGWVEAEPGRDGSGTGCHLTTGLLADLLRRVAGEDVAVMEVGYEVPGSDRCRFLIGGPETLMALHREVEQGYSIDDALTRLG
ncbi:MAG: hypothetical protein H0X65_17845 [Gemmatimonadetes bacterium]|nr:hypothetical protein [Gemmatimonadota bacterium]